MSAAIQDIYFTRDVGNSKLSYCLAVYRKLTDIAMSPAFNSLLVKPDTSPSKLGDALKSCRSFLDVSEKANALKVDDLFQVFYTRKLGRKETITLLNPFIFLPSKSCFENNLALEKERVELFYSAIILGDNRLIDSAYNKLAKVLSSEKDKAFYSGLFKLAMMISQGEQKKLQVSEIDVEVLAYYFLLTGDFRTQVKISQSHQQILKEIMNVFLKDIYEKKVVEVNEWTLSNKIFLLLGARDAINSGDFGLARACLNSTFCLPKVLNRFGPDNQAFFYFLLQFNILMKDNDSLLFVQNGLSHLAAHLEHQGVSELKCLVQNIRDR
ncbi:MAG: hypothetical protein MUF15_04095 [Acidobacteria bacterium]|nr:hypothetical protein [Acidobacteriota bacterium]